MHSGRVMRESGQASMDADDEGGGNLLAHLPAILWQRRWLVIAPLILGSIAALLAVLLVPPVYRSTALMLVQTPQLPTEILGDTGGELIERRIARFKEQITSRPDLISLIESRGLYERERSSKPLSDVITKMRDAITLTPTTVDAPGGKADQRTVAFELAFNYKDAAQAQAVAQALMERVLELDSSTNAEQATNTVQFLTDQAKSLEDQIASVQGEMSAINSRYGGVLASNGLTMLGGNGGSYDVQIASLQRDNSTLISQRELAKSSDTRDPVVVNAEAQLAAARATYSESHPDVILARQRLAEAREFAKNDSRKPPTEVIDQQIAFNNSQIAGLRAAKSREQAQISTSMSAQARAPLVQQQVAELQQRLTGLNAQYQTVSERLMAAKAGVRAEDEQMGERLAVIDPPVLPDTPIEPNRWKLVGLGIGGGLALGVLLAFLLELVLRPIRDPDTLTRITGQPPLGTVPMLATSATRQRRRWIPEIRPFSRIRSR